MSLKQYTFDPEDVAHLSSLQWDLQEAYQGKHHTRTADGKLISLPRYIMSCMHGIDIPKNREIIHLNADQDDMRKENLHTRQWVSQLN